MCHQPAMTEQVVVLMGAYASAEVDTYQISKAWEGQAGVSGMGQADSNYFMGNKGTGKLMRKSQDRETQVVEQKTGVTSPTVKSRDRVTRLKCFTCW